MPTTHRKTVRYHPLVTAHFDEAWSRRDARLRRGDLPGSSALPSRLFLDADIPTVRLTEQDVLRMLRSMNEASTDPLDQEDPPEAPDQ